MSTLVMKFGGASVSSASQFAPIASLIASRAREYKKLVVVVSAMGDTTDELLKLARTVNPSPPKRELDMLVTVGERISCSLLAMALEGLGLAAVSLTGSQSGIITCDRHTDARVVEMRPHRIVSHMDAGRIVVIAGFQGVSRGGEITTLGRGGSDTSAVALGVALGADRVEFYKDVAGVYEEDPKINPEARLIDHLSYDEALALTLKSGHEVLHSRCIALAQMNKLPLHVRCFKEVSSPGTIIGTKIREATLPLYETV
jgi:aspartate kinase